MEQRQEEVALRPPPSPLIASIASRACTCRLGDPIAILRFMVMASRAVVPSQLLYEIPLPGAVLLDRLARGLGGREEVLHRVTTILADLVTELEPLGLSNASDADAVDLGAARGRERR